MASNKPVGQSWESYTDALFHQAERNGEFSNLPGAGRPIPGLDQPYDENWWLKQMLQREDLSALPDSLRFKLELQKELDQLPRIPFEDELRKRIDQINARIRKIEFDHRRRPAAESQHARLRCAHCKVARETRQVVAKKL